MNRAALEHLIRAASAITQERDLVIVGSQAILGTMPMAPTVAPELCVSREADIYPMQRPELADLIDGAIGYGSAFDEQFGYYADGVGPETAVLPNGWQTRLVKVENENTGGGVGWRLDVHDLAVAKLAAGREKDLAFVEAMLTHGIVGGALLRERVAATALQPERRELVQAWLAGRK